MSERYQYYKGNSIIHWHNKAIMYGDCIMKCWDAVKGITFTKGSIDEVVAEVVDYTIDLEAKNKAMHEAFSLLIKEFESFIDQYGCDCGHTWCKPCADTIEARTVIKYTEKLYKT